MAGQIAEAHHRAGLRFGRELDAALPIPVWVVDLEVEGERSVSAAERAVLRLVAADGGDLDVLTTRLGLGTDTRLAEDVLVKALAEGAVERDGDGFAITAVGHAWIRRGSSRQRERLTFDLSLDPAIREFDWMGHERPARSDGAWPIELPQARDEELTARVHEVGRIVREKGLPDDQDNAPRDRRVSPELVALAIRERRIHWRAVRVDTWQDEDGKQTELVGHVSDAEHAGLTRLLAGFRIDEKRRRLCAPRDRPDR